MPKHIELIAKLDDFASRLVNIFDLDELVKKGAEIIDEVVDVEYSGMYILNPKTRKMGLLYAKGFTEEEKLEASRTAMDRHPGWVMRNNKILNIPDVDLDTEGVSSDSKRGFKVRSRLWLPVIVNGRSVGAFGFASQYPNQFTDEHVAVLRFITNIVSVVYMNIQYKHDQENVQENLKRSLDEIKRAKELKEKFLANMSHEIRTPMNAIIGMTHLLNSTELTEEQSTYLESISVSSEHLLALLNDILDFSKIEAGQLNIEKIPFSIKTISDRLYHSLIIKIEEKQLSYISKTDTSINEKLLGDPLRITQVLTNLISNAIKFTEKGQVSLDIQLLNDYSDQQELLFIVQDSGIGIDLDKQDKIFDSFKQEDDSITRKYGGSGLGLAISKEIVELMGGTISLYSEKGKGTQFKVKLMFEKTFEKSNEKTESPSDTTTVNHLDTQPLRPLHVLIVEDDKFNMFFARSVIQQMGFTTDEAVNGIEAIEKIKQQQYDVVLMDMQMPEMDGISATKVIRQELKNTTPIIALTANVIKGDYERCIEAGMNDYVSKPINVEELRNKICQWAEIGC